MDFIAPLTAPLPASLVRHYRPPAGAFDEFLDASGEPRSHWQPLVAALDGMSADERARRWEGIRRRLWENGVSYNIYDDPRGVGRPWTLDPMPLVIDAPEWAPLAAGLAQRATLLDLVLADCYGPQHLVRDGLLPPELLFANPGFLLSCHGALPMPAKRLVFYAADLGHTADGQWHLLADRAQSPSGAGYALENRIALADALPEAFSTLQVHRLAAFFATMRDTLARLAPSAGRDPRIVILTPGPFNETYFEHVFLARYLGYTLVEGADLTVRDGAVFLKVLGGLQPVDVIVRRLDDDYCDPLELRPDSSLGVPGLLQAVRSGRVVVANALGAGLVEMPALLPFLPAICRRLLGEDMRLPSAVTWWCGDPTVREHVLARLDHMVIKPAFPALQREPIFARLLDRTGREALTARIRACPHEFVAQEELALATAPVLQGDRLHPRHVTTRCYLVAHGAEYALMPGGLTRAASGADTRVVSMQRGGASKDTWVLSPTPVKPFSLLEPTGQPVVLTRGSPSLQSRVADNLFWLGRYTARCEGIVRMLRCLFLRLGERTSAGDEVTVRTLARGLATMVPLSIAPDDAQQLDRELFALLRDDDRPGTLRGTVQALGRVARTVRDRISWDAWRLIIGLDAAVGGRRRSPLRRPADALERLDRVLMRLSALDGFVVESMTRGEIWHFLDTGRRLERSMQLLHVLAGILGTPVDPEPPVLDALLEFADSGMTYRRRYGARFQPHAVLDLLVLDDTNPRSLVFQLIAIDRHVRGLPRDVPATGSSREEQLATETLAAVRLANADDLAGGNSSGQRSALLAFTAQIGDRLAALSEAVSQRYLSHAQLPQQLRRQER
jgi:uncharacterized circularly permuted ATP-grasp superfamily protein/uncharacterized alpha-E superfamily protein